MPFDVIVGRDESDKKAFGNRGLAYIGKSYVTMGAYTSLSNPIYLDVARSHVIMIAGKRGSGKCLTGDTLITLDDGSQLAIQDLENVDKKILSLNDKLKMEAISKSDFFSREVEKILKIKLRSGKEIKLTPEHPLLTLKGWVPVKELGLGSRIATPRKTLFGKEDMKEHEIKLLAYLLAEGHLSNGFVLFSNFDKKIENEFRECINNFDDNLRVDVHSKEGCFRVSQKEKRYSLGDIERNSKGQFKGNNIKYEKSSINQWLRGFSLYDKLSIDKFIPQEVMKLKKEQLAIFLNRLFSCDGSVYSKKVKSGSCWQISYSSSSEQLIRQVQSLLLRFEILSKLRRKNVKCNNKIFEVFELVLDASNVLNFLEEVGFYGDKCEKGVIAQLELLAKKRNPNVDTIPLEVWEMYKPSNWAEVGRKLGYKYPKAMRERINYCPSRQTLLQVAEAEQSSPLMMLAMSDVFWDEIVGVELLEGKFKVYDICVPENHNFVANDIIVHNSYTIGTMAEAISSLNIEEASNIAPLIFDTMGIFWTMKFKNEKDRDLLDEWGLSAKNIPLRVFAPFGYYQDYKDKGIDVDAEFAIKISELEPTDWINIFELRFTEPIAVLIESVISELKEKKRTFGFGDISRMINLVKNVSEEVKHSAIALFDAAKTWKVFDEERGTSIRELVRAGETTVIDLSMYASLGAFNVRALIIGLVCKRLFDERMSARKDEEIQSVQHGIDYMRYNVRREMPLVWVFIDEAHEFLPKVGKTPATDALVQLLREGRQPGISMVLATQQPGKIHTDAMTQSDIVISHRVTAKPDVEALNEITQSYLYESISDKLNGLPHLKGSAIILDDNSERIYPIRIRPRFTWHGGEAPAAIKRVDEEL